MSYTLAANVVGRSSGKSFNPPPLAEDTKLKDIAAMCLRQAKIAMMEAASGGTPMPYKIGVEVADWPDGRVRWRLEGELIHHRNEDRPGWFIKWGYVDQLWRAATSDPSRKWPSKGLGKVPA